jgi:thiamine transporter
MKATKTSAILTECAILVAMAFILSFISIIKMPFGGAVTAASMLPIIIAGYRHGLKWGLISGFTYSLLQLLTGVANVSYATSTIAAIAIIMLDYIVAFTVLGLVGILKRNSNQTLVLTLGTLVVCFLRFMCHFITGCTVWAGVSIPSADGMIYSMVYNGAYMIPETVVTIYVAALISNSLDLRVERPVTKKKSADVSAILNGIMILGIAIVIDFLYLFQQIQSEDGFDITGIKNTNWSTVAIITLVGAVIGIAVYFISKTVIQKRKVKVA